MADPVVTDLFKFVAIRPAHLPSDAEVERSIMRDGRTGTQDGVSRITVLARELAQSAQALSRWAELDLAPLRKLAGAHREVLERYGRLGEGDDAPDGREWLSDAGVPDAAGMRADPLWDALYIAFRSGPDAGPRVAIPLAALRLLHFAKLVAGDARPAVADALAALEATPVVPLVFGESTAVLPALPAAHGATTSRPGASERTARLRELAREIDTTEHLLENVTSAPALASPAVHASAPEPAGNWMRRQFSVSTVPTLRGVLEGRIGRESAAVLERLRLPEAAPVPVAAQSLQAHLSKLNDVAFELHNDPEFQGIMREMKGTLAVAPAIDLETVAHIDAIVKDPSTAPEVSVAGRIAPLGIGDLKVVKQTLLAYVPGEVAHIENVLKGESKERKHRKLDRTETTVFISEEESRETERDTQTTDRFELKRETEQTIKEDMSVKAGLTVTATLGPVITTATGDFAYATSKQDSQKNSSNFARDVVDRSVSKVQTKTRTERTTKTLSEVEEINTHGLNNTEPAAGHITGIYRWVDKRYRAQVYNYGVRLMLEFIVPEPAAFFRAAQLRKKVRDVNATPPEDFLNKKGGPLTISDITEADYRTYASRYNAAGVTPPPPLYTYIGTSIVKDGLDEGKTIGMSSKEFVVPDGYTLVYYSATASVLWINYPQFCLQVGRDPYVLLNDQSGKATRMTTVQPGSPDEVTGPAGSVPVSVASYDVKGFAVNVQGVCQRTTPALVKWQIQTFDKIYSAYQALKTAYEQKVTQAEASAGIPIDGRNPAINRAIEQTELKKLCITMMTGQHFSRFNSMTDPSDKPAHYPEIDINDALGEGPIIQFFEQAFEWGQMTYLFYPYFWGRKTNWVDISKLTDPDPLFMNFLTAGAARVVVPVPMPYVGAVQYMLQSKEPDLLKRVWRGGETPVLDSDLYVSIAEEMRRQTDDLAGATPEGDPWEFTVPTTLVWLQPDSTLPSYL